MLLQDFRLTPHFRLMEFIHADDWELYDNLNMTERAQLHYALRELAERLEKIRHAIEGPIRITSGWRPPARNKRVGGVPTSDHMTGYACDFQSPGLLPEAIYHEVRRLWGRGELKFDQLILYRTHVHFSASPRNRGHSFVN